MVLTIHQSCDWGGEYKDSLRGHIIGPSWDLHLSACSSSKTGFTTMYINLTLLFCDWRRRLKPMLISRRYNCCVPKNRTNPGQVTCLIGLLPSELYILRQYKYVLFTTLAYPVFQNSCVQKKNIFEFCLTSILGIPEHRNLAFWSESQLRCYGPRHPLCRM
jgi:hypothetical protein